MAKYTICEADGHIFAVSDIHARPDVLSAALKKAGYNNKSDTLVIVGDVTGRGPDSLGALRAAMKLTEEGAVFIRGNWDDYAADIIEERSPEHIISHYLKKENTLFTQMRDEAGLSGLPTREAMRAVARIYRKELDFIKNAPVIAEYRNRGLVFVHGGILPGVPYDELDDWGCMKFDAFYKTGYSFDKTVVVGHWPVTLYRRDAASSNPIIDLDRNIISIDGGLGTKRDGQLNVMRFDPDGTISFTAADELPRARAVTAQRGAPATVNLRWIDNSVDFLGESDGYVTLRRRSDGKVFRAPSQYYEPSRELCDDWCDRYLPVEPGDELAVVGETAGYRIVKKDGESGIYAGELIYERADLQ